MGHNKSTVIAQHKIEVPKQNNTLKKYVYQKHIHHSSCFTWCTFQSLAARNWVVPWLPPIENTYTSAHTRLSALSTFLALNEYIQAQKHTVSIPQSSQQLIPAPVFREGVRLCDRLARKEVYYMHYQQRPLLVLDVGHYTTWDRCTNKACLATQTIKKH